jgi:hypothetical protein
MPAKNLNSEVRLLLTVWGAENGAIKKSELTKRLVRKGETSKDYRPTFDQLLKDGSIALAQNQITLTAQGVEALGQGLSNADFEFAGNVGAKTVNALLKWIRQNNHAATVAPTNGKTVPAINSYDQFKQLTIEVYDRLNRDYNMGNLVPIYRIRREMGERVNRGQFSDWLFAMQSDDVFELLEESVEDSAPDKIEDSVTTKFGKLRCYAKRLAS